MLGRGRPSAEKCHKTWARSRHSGLALDRDRCLTTLTKTFRGNHEDHCPARCAHLCDHFGNYRRLVYLAQAPKPDAEAAARKVAERLGLELVVRQTGFGGLGGSLARVAGRPWLPAWPA